MGTKNTRKAYGKPLSEKLSEKKPKGTTSDETKALLRPVIELIKSNAAKVARIASNGELPVVVYEPEGPISMGALKMLGWKKDDAVFPISKEKAVEMLGKADEVTERWVNRIGGEQLQVFVVAYTETYLLNGGEEGFSLEPGSADGAK